MWVIRNDEGQYWNTSCSVWEPLYQYGIVMTWDNCLRVIESGVVMGSAPLTIVWVT